MAFDGLMTAALVKELSDTLTGGRIIKIAQPEKDELQLQIKNYDTYKLLISADASLPLLYLTDESKQSPLSAPNFCMLLRKHFNSARILSVTQPGLERIVDFTVEHLNELGDICRKHIMVELMGKHSNIILVDENGIILDAIKRVSGMVSSVREVLPGRPYFIPQTQEKLNPLTVSFEEFLVLREKPMPLGKSLYTTFTGLSPQTANELCHRAGLSPDLPAAEFSEDFIRHLFRVFTELMEDIKAGVFLPNLIRKDGEPIAFSATALTLYKEDDYEAEDFSSVSALLQEFYSEKNTVTRIRQRSSDLRRVLQSALEREVKKYDLQLKQLKDTESREKYKVYGELLTAYGYSVEPGAKETTVTNYYTNEPLTIPLDETLSALDNAKRYFERYSKLKRTFEALSTQVEETKSAILHLESIKNSLEIARHEEDLVQIKAELTEYGYLKKHAMAANGGRGKKEKKVRITSKPLHYRTSDGFDIYVGKNNYQNDYLTFEFANGNDWWFHAKDCAGSHVILKNDGRAIPDHVFEDAGALAAFYSKNKDAGKVEIDYVDKKQVKKPNGAKPGFVVYYTNYSLMATPDISGLTEIND
ncbi:MAG: NFACT RNA binding domain-containing protein [Lachnospiraceae bacterium]|nr:NFACT RNA binding domain-containing protein [Lachnospiraceae bacterium]